MRFLACFFDKARLVVGVLVILPVIFRPANKIRLTERKTTDCLAEGSKGRGPHCFTLVWCFLNVG